ncbi:MAG TPA: preprotein translocase subunit SecA [Candidatus Onthoplasma faecipullorum]|nr:preprotein translocase subunit SecA [Candidatus Onthoplasma faecipullorum]
MMGLFSYLFASDNKRSLMKIEKIVKKIEDLADKYADMSDADLQAQTPILKDRLSAGETLDDILPDAFALVREASTRVLHQRHFHVQLIGGVVLHQGRIAEMKTGEGKTLTATTAVYLNALSGKNVHVITVNEYLASSQAEMMGKLYKFLGLTIGVTLAGQTPDEKKKAYECDITYGTNNEFGFDYLRDNMQVNKQYKVQRGHNFCIVDEVDSILIDEARTPLIISGIGGKTSELYTVADNFVKRLKEEDYEVDIKTKQVRLTESGVTKAEQFFKLENLSDINNLEINHHINKALSANIIMKKDINYIVKDGEILIVDEFTGRIMQGRRYSDGLHQAIEAKEHVKIKDENKTLATITLQNYFKLYSKLSGMTGTAKTEESEFNKIYSLDVVTIPTNKPVLRVDEQDMIFYTENAKYKAIVEEIKDKYEKGQPILVGTSSVEKSERISKEIKRLGIPHNLLNAKNHELESQIVAQSGRVGAVTIATNMAGRGTDILLGGNPEFLAKQKLLNENVEPEMIEKITTYNSVLNEEEQAVKDKYDKYFAEFKKTTDAEKQKVIELGGLHILGTERHESRRIDNQLRGRAGRQGDPGSSIFFISLEDELPQRFGEDRMKSWFSLAFKGSEDMPLQSRILTRFFETAQKKVEAINFESRKRVLEYDDVLNKQRQIIYAERDKVLDGVDIHPQIVDMMHEYVSDLVNTYLDASKPSYEWELEPLNKALEDKLLDKGSNMVTNDLVEDCTVEQVTEKVFENILSTYEKKIEEIKKLGLDFSIIERDRLLRVVDKFWTDHIDAMNTLRNEIGILAYGQKDPIVAYKNQGFEMFDKMIQDIREYTASSLYRTKVQIRLQPVMPKGPVAMGSTNKSENSGAKRNSSHIGRNDLCPCGSGKKYKNCCMLKEKK